MAISRAIKTDEEAGKSFLKPGLVSEFMRDANRNRN